MRRPSLQALQNAKATGVFVLAASAASKSSSLRVRTNEFRFLLARSRAGLIALTSASVADRTKLCSTSPIQAVRNAMTLNMEFERRFRVAQPKLSNGFDVVFADLN